MGPEDRTIDTPAFRRLGDQLTRSLVATATLLAIASLFACWFGTRAVVDGIVKYEGRLGSDRVPIIAATAHAFQEDREKCILAGMDDFLSKPYTRKDIVPIMERWIGSDAVALPAPQADIRAAGKTVTKDQGLLDPATIDQLRAMDASGEDRIFRKVAGIFLDTTPDQLEGLKGHLANEDAPGIALIAHGLKTAAANVAALSLSQLFRELELAAREEDLHTCGTLSEDVFDLFGKVAAALKEVTEADRSVRESA
jgi:two-component system sensor histidine kinase/response regulator